MTNLPKMDHETAGRPLPMTRACGACSACCTVLEIPSLGKRKDTRCAHVSPANGCAVYGDTEKRPKACDAYLCAWRAGVYGGQLDRPDKTGIVVDMHFADEELGRPIGPYPVVMVREWRFGALDGHAGAQALQKLSERFVCIVNRYGKPANVFTVFGPAEAGAAFKARLARMPNATAPRPIPIIPELLPKGS